MVVPELNCCALDSFRLFTVSSPQIEEDPFEYSATAEAGAGTGSLHPEAIEAAAEVTKPLEPWV